MNKFDAHILVVDDDEGIRNLVKQYLNENNYLITTAISAEDAKEKTSIIKFDLIVLDVMMPGKSGLEFTVENKEKINTPIILLTAKGEAEERIEGLEVGADDYLPKPFEPKELILRIKNILNKTKSKYQKRFVEFDNIKIDLNKLIIIKNDSEFKINNTEIFEFSDGIINNVTPSSLPGDVKTFSTISPTQYYIYYVGSNQYYIANGAQIPYGYNMEYSPTGNIIYFRNNIKS